MVRIRTRVCCYLLTVCVLTHGHEHERIGFSIEAWQMSRDGNELFISLWSRVFYLKNGFGQCEGYFLVTSSSNNSTRTTLCNCSLLSSENQNVIRCRTILRMPMGPIAMKLEVGVTLAKGNMQAQDTCNSLRSANLELEIDPKLCLGQEQISDWAQCITASILSLSGATDLDVDEPAIITANVVKLHESHGRGPLSSNFRRFLAAGGCHMLRPGCLDYLSVLLRLPSLRFHLPARSADWHGMLGCPEGQCGACALVGNAWHLLGADHGAEIDAHDVVVRFGAAAPTVGFEADVGERTTLRVVVRPYARLFALLQQYSHSRAHVAFIPPRHALSTFMKIRSALLGRQPGIAIYHVLGRSALLRRRTGIAIYHFFSSCAMLLLPIHPSQPFKTPLRNTFVDKNFTIRLLVSSLSVSTSAPLLHERSFQRRWPPCGSTTPRRQPSGRQALAIGPAMAAGRKSRKRCCTSSRDHRRMCAVFWRRRGSGAAAAMPAAACWQCPRGSLRRCGRR
jgi:hypothetical protein